jgi:nitrous oxidase accessory protein NosD
MLADMTLTSSVLGRHVGHDLDPPITLTSPVLGRHVRHDVLVEEFQHQGDTVGKHQMLTHKLKLKGKKQLITKSYLNFIHLQQQDKIRLHYNHVSRIHDNFQVDSSQHNIYSTCMLKDWCFAHYTYRV